MCQTLIDYHTHGKMTQGNFLYLSKKFSQFNCIMCGSSGSGKTTRLLEFLQLKDVICNAKFYKIYYFYSTWQSKRRKIRKTWHFSARRSKLTKIGLK